MFQKAMKKKNDLMLETEYKFFRELVTKGMEVCKGTFLFCILVFTSYGIEY